MTDRFPKSLLIDGKTLEGASDGAIELTEPATETPLCAVPAVGEKEIDQALQAAQRGFAQGSWSSSNPAARSEALFRLARAIRENCERLARIEARNVGKPIGDARWEINAGARCFEFYAGAITQFGGRTIPVAKNGFDYTIRQPVGVVAAIVPWNFPFLMACWKVAPALATGNSVVLKPASLTPLSALALGELAWEAGVPGNILQVIAGRGSVVGDYLTGHPLVRKIAFTGETGTGARILRQAAGDIKRVSLELGGKSPNVIFADADVDAAAEAAPMAVFANTGQDCCARSRVLVERSVFDRFSEGFVAATKRLIVGDPLSEETQVGPLVSSGQRETVERYIAIAEEEGGKRLVGGSRPQSPGYYLAPTIFAGLPSKARVCQEEIFGPVACILPFESEAEAIALANDTQYGLSGSIWTRDIERALRVARAVESGVLSVNTNSSVHQEAPFGGFKRSGFGRDLGVEAMQLYTELKNVYIDLSGGK
ncbi:MAG: aldehyde dehydrogenase [Deltaproteobacteria bacterium]|nr:aldehyde dehydrogenase [Deltaproteobacteria bacterium]